MTTADQVADALVELMHGRDKSELELVLHQALDRYELARLGAVARTRLGQLRAERIPQQVIAADVAEPGPTTCPVCQIPLKPKFAANHMRSHL